MLAAWGFVVSSQPLLEQPPTFCSSPELHTYPRMSATFFSLLVCQSSLSPCPWHPKPFPHNFPCPYPELNQVLKQIFTPHTLFTWILLFSAALFLSSFDCSLWCTLSVQLCGSALCTCTSITCLKTWSLHPFPSTATSTRKQLLHIHVSCPDFTSPTKTFLSPVTFCDSPFDKRHLCFLQNKPPEEGFWQLMWAAMTKCRRMGWWQTGSMWKNPRKWQYVEKPPKNHSFKQQLTTN